MSCRRRWGEGSQNTALFGAEELNEYFEYFELEN